MRKKSLPENDIPDVDTHGYGLSNGLGRGEHNGRKIRWDYSLSVMAGNRAGP
jgi:hypothetical protein